MYFDIRILTPIFIHANTILEGVIHSNMTVVDAFGTPILPGTIPALFIIWPTFSHRVNGRLIHWVICMSMVGLNCFEVLLYTLINCLLSLICLYCGFIESYKFTILNWIEDLSISHSVAFMQISCFLHSFHRTKRIDVRFIKHRVWVFNHTIESMCIYTV